MAKIVRVEQMVAIERAANANGFSYAAMMEEAGRTLAAEVIASEQALANQRILILVGPGNNGGDGLVAAHYLSEAGADVAVYLSHPRAENDINLKRITGRVGIVPGVDDEELECLTEHVQSAAFVVDALLGTGFRLPMREPIGRILRGVKHAMESMDTKPRVIAVDCPSGMNCDTGEIAEEILAADLTITFAAAKRGHFRFPGAAYTGELRVVGIGIPDDQKEINAVELDMMNMAEAASFLPARPKDSHKGTFGTVLVVAGSVNYPGAPVLAAKGAYRAGAGLVRVAVPAPVQTAMAASLPEAVWTLLPHELGVLSDSAVHVLAQELSGADALVFGPGFGREESTQRFTRAMFMGEDRGTKGVMGFVGTAQTEQHEAGTMPPLVIDADGLRLLGKLEDWPDQIPPNCILTPHPGEMAALTGETVEAIQKDRVATAKTWSEKWGQVLVLKGAFTVIAAPDGRASVIPIASSALATAGSGDVLSGVIAALLAQGCQPYEAAALGAFVHARAGELAADASGDEASVLAGDIADQLGIALSDLRRHTS